MGEGPTYRLWVPATTGGATCSTRRGLIREDLRDQLMDAQRRRLAPVRAPMDADVQTCRACLHENAAEQLLTETLGTFRPLTVAVKSITVPSHQT